MEIEISRKLFEEIQDYCKANQIPEIDKFIEKLLKKGFDLEKWGDINIVCEPKEIPVIEKQPEMLVPTPTNQNNEGEKPPSGNKKRIREPKILVKGKSIVPENQSNDNIYGD